MYGNIISAAIIFNICTKRVPNNFKCLHEKLHFHDVMLQSVDCKSDNRKLIVLLAHFTHFNIR